MKTKAQLDGLGAEHYLDSVIYGDVAYTVVEGFLGDLSPATRSLPRATTEPAPVHQEEDAFVERTDVRLVRDGLSIPAAAPAAVNLPPAPPKMSEAEALSQLFLSTVLDK